MDTFRKVHKLEPHTSRQFESDIKEMYDNIAKLNINQSKEILADTLTNPEEIGEIIRKLKNNKAPGGIVDIAI